MPFFVEEVVECRTAKVENCIVHIDPAGKTSLCMFLCENPLLRRIVGCRRGEPLAQSSILVRSQTR